MASQYDIVIVRFQKNTQSNISIEKVLSARAPGCQMSDVSLEGKVVHYKCVHLLGCICCGGNNGSAAGNVGEKAEKCIWLLRNWNKQGDHKRVVRGGSRAKH